MDDASRREPAFEAESEAYDLFQRGVALLRDHHAHQAALLLARALRLEPRRPSIREALARAEFARGDHESAAELFAGLIADAPDADYAQFGLGRSLVALGRGEEARVHLRLACALAPGNAVYGQALADLDAPADA